MTNKRYDNTITLWALRTWTKCWTWVGEWIEWSGYPLDCYDQYTTCGAKNNNQTIHFRKTIIFSSKCFRIYEAFTVTKRFDVTESSCEKNSATLWVSHHAHGTSRHSAEYYLKMIHTLWIGLPYTFLSMELWYFTCFHISVFPTQSPLNKA